MASKQTSNGAERPAMADRRSRIIAIATKRFAEFGFEATTVRQIADDVNILSGSLYHHFATKDDILHEVVRDVVIQMRDNTLRIAGTPVDPERRLIALILLDVGELTRHQQAHAILYNERKFFRRSKEFAYVVKAKKDSYLAWRSVLEEGIRDGLFRSDLDIYLTIMTSLRMLNAAADWYRNEEATPMDAGGDYSLDQMKDFYVAFILAAVRDPRRTSEPIARKDCEALVQSRASDAVDRAAA